MASYKFSVVSLEQGTMYGAKNLALDQGFVASLEHWNTGEENNNFLATKHRPR